MEWRGLDKTVDGVKQMHEPKEESKDKSQTVEKTKHWSDDLNESQMWYVYQTC